VSFERISKLQKQIDKFYKHASLPTRVSTQLRADIHSHLLTAKNQQTLGGNYCDSMSSKTTPLPCCALQVKAFMSSEFFIACMKSHFHKT